jgi:hypothetical protein
MRTVKILTLSIGLLLSCVDPYNPPQGEQENSYLVVDGYVDLGQGSSTIVLSRTINLGEPNEIIPQTGAQVSIRFEDGASYNLLEIEAGKYYTDGLSVSENDRCRLFIRSNGINYESDVVSAKATPEIDSVTYSADETGVQIQVTTHDPGNNTWYYQWQYEETARYHAEFRSAYYWTGPGDFDISLRTAENDIYRCWKTIPSTTILVGTSANLSEDVIYKFPLTFLSATSWKHEYRYSILVKQFAIDKELYNYLVQLKKNTEQLGTLFDPQPSEVRGNIKCIDDSSIPVLGYFSMRSVREKRIYIARSELPPYNEIIDGYEHCFFNAFDTLMIGDPEIDVMQFRTSLLVNGILSPFGSIVGYTTQAPSCIDCRIVRDGTTQKPEWWEE